MLWCVIFAALIVGVLSIDVTFENVTLLGNSKPVWIGPNNLQSIVLEKNIYNISFEDGDLIPVLYNNTFANFNQLESIDLANHGVEEIHPRAFNKLRMLKDLVLDDNELTDIKTGVFKDLKNLIRLSLSRNHIESIEAGAFDNLQNLNFLFLGGNNLTTFYPKWFKEKPFLFVVDLTDNSIENIPNGAFEFYHQAIFLGGNKINNLTRNIWGSGKQLMELSLHDNEIDSWDEDLFNGILIKSLDVTYNQIECINGTLSKLFVAGYISIRGNPWDCDCINEIVDWWWKRGNETVILDWGDAIETCNSNNVDNNEQPLEIS